MKKKWIIEKKDCALRVRKIRKEYDYSQEHMSELLNISLAAYKKIESGENNVSLNVLTEIKNKFGISADYILYGDEKTSNDSYSMFINSNDTEKLRSFIRMVLYYSAKKQIALDDEYITDKKINEIIKKFSQ